MDIELLQGPQIAPHIEDLARLRITVFREFPYLYDGSLDYEAEYLDTYVRSADSLCVLVRDEGRVVGASTALPLADETPEFQQPFLAAGWDPTRIFYCAESVLLPGWRGLGLGVRFFAEREAHARKLARIGGSAEAQLALYRRARSGGADHRAAVGEVVDTLMQQTALQDVRQIA